MTAKNSTDRHRAESVQLKAWVPGPLRERFNACCAAQGVTSASVLRDLLEVYCTQVEAVLPEQGRGAHGQD